MGEFSVKRLDCPTWTFQLSGASVPHFHGGDARETPGMRAALTDSGINRGIVPDLPTPVWRKTNSPPKGPEQIKYTLLSSTPGVTAIRGGLSAGGTEKGGGKGEGAH